MKLAVYCKHCSREIPGNPANFGRGSAYCPACEKVTPLDANAMRPPKGGPASALPRQTPPGCSVTTGDVITVTARVGNVATGVTACVMSLGYMVFMAFLVLAAIGATLDYGGYEVPAWLPRQNEDRSWSSGVASGFSGTLMDWLILTPFLVFGLALATVVVPFLLFGVYQVRIGGDRGSVFMGIRRFGITRRFDASAVTSVRERDEVVEDDDEGYTRVRRFILVRAERGLKFGSMMPVRHRAWMTAVLRELLVR